MLPFLDADRVRLHELLMCYFFFSARTHTLHDHFLNSHVYRLTWILLSQPGIEIKSVEANLRRQSRSTSSITCRITQNGQIETVLRLKARAITVVAIWTHVYPSVCWRRTPYLTTCSSNQYHKSSCFPMVLSNESCRRWKSLERSIHISLSLIANAVWAVNWECIYQYDISFAQLTISILFWLLRLTKHLTNCCGNRKTFLLLSNHSGSFCFWWDFCSISSSTKKNIFHYVTTPYSN